MVGFLAAEYEKTRQLPKKANKWDTFKGYHEAVAHHFVEKKKTNRYHWSLPAVSQFLNNKKIAVVDGKPSVEIRKSFKPILPVEIWVPTAAAWQEKQQNPATLCRFEEYICGAYAVDAALFRFGLQNCCNNQNKREYFDMMGANYDSLWLENEALRKRNRALETELKTLQNCHSELKTKYALVAQNGGQGRMWGM